MRNNSFPPYVADVAPDGKLTRRPRAPIIELHVEIASLLRSLFLGADIVDVLWSAERARPADGLSLSWVFPLVAFGVTSLPVAENGGEEAGGEGGRRTEGGRGGGGDFPASNSHMDSSKLEKVSYFECETGRKLTGCIAVFITILYQRLLLLPPCL